jgi:hypothetical protein
MKRKSRRKAAQREIELTGLPAYYTQAWIAM